VLGGYRPAFGPLLTAGNAEYGVKFEGRGATSRTLDSQRRGGSADRQTLSSDPCTLCQPGAELRFFGGLSVGETAALLCVSQHTMMRDWRLARAWLASELGLTPET
jgi:hypothetical protein